MCLILSRPLHSRMSLWPLASPPSLNAPSGWGNAPHTCANMIYRSIRTWETSPVPGLRHNVFQRDMRKVTLETTFLNRWFSWAPDKPTWTWTQVFCRHPACWQLQFFLFQFQFLLIFKILISEMYAIIVLQCLAIYLCLLFYARLILSHWSRRQPSLGLLLRCHVCPQARKERHSTLSPEGKHSTEPHAGDTHIW